MFERLYRIILKTLPRSKGVTLVVTVIMLGGATFSPYLADVFIDDYDELKYEHMIQRDKIKLLIKENDSLQEKLRQQSTQFSRELYSAAADFNQKIYELNSVPLKTTSKPKKLPTRKIKDNIKKDTIVNIIVVKSDTSPKPLIKKDTNIKNPISMPSPSPSAKRWWTLSSKKEHNFLNFLKHKKQKPEINPVKKP